MILDEEEKIRELDKGNILGSIRDLPEQVKQVWEEINKVKLPEDYKRTDNVVICGMGGSALGGRIVDCLFTDSLRGSIEVFTGYNVPDYVGPETLLILCSYSGNTQETLQSAKEARKRNACSFILASGGKLAEFASKEKLPAYIYNPVHNPSAQPRMGLGYSLTAILNLMHRCGFITVGEDEIEKSVDMMRSLVKEYDVLSPSNENLAKKLSERLLGKSPILVASEHLVGSTHVFKNQLNENSKTFATSFDIPELNHHLMEGLSNPRTLKPLLHFIFFTSKLYPENILKRYVLTKEVVEKNDISAEIFELMGTSKVMQAFEMLVLSSYVSFYLAILYGINPAPIPWVDYFKNKLAE